MEEKDLKIFQGTVKMGGGVGVQVNLLNGFVRIPHVDMARAGGGLPWTPDQLVCPHLQVL